jgi:uncharacterized repeat protein (TIGR01451 family)
MPEPDEGTSDRWTLPFLPSGGFNKIVVQMRVKETLIGGGVHHNEVSAEDELGNVAMAGEDTVVEAREGLTASIEDYPDPAEPGQAVTYTLTSGNASFEDLSDVVVRTVYDDELAFSLASPPPDAGTDNTWTIGDLDRGTASRIYVTMVPKATLGDGGQAEVRMWVSDLAVFPRMIAEGSRETSHTASAIESTVFTSRRNPYVVTIIGVPKNPSIDVNSTVSYSIRVRNVTSNTLTNVRVVDFLPDALAFLSSLPPPSIPQTGNTVEWTFPAIQPGDAKLILLKTGLILSTNPGTVLENVVSVTDDQENQATESFTGFVRGQSANLPPMRMIMTSVNRAFPGQQFNYSINVKNTGLVVADDVVVSDPLPPEVTFVQSTPDPTGTVPGGGFSWRLGDLIRGSQRVIRITVRLKENVAPGTVVVNNAEAKDSAGNSAFDTNSLNVVER